MKVTLNSTDNVIALPRIHDAAGAHVAGTLTIYEKPAASAYEEVNTAALLNVLIADVSFYSPLDGTIAIPTCSGAATASGSTIQPCAMFHLTEAETAVVFLNSQDFTSCPAIDPNPAGTTTSSVTSTAVGLPTAMPFTGNAAALSAHRTVASFGAFAATFI